MIPLGNTYGKNGFHYELVTRHGDLAIFKQRLRPGVGCLAYEVIRIKKVKECTMFGRIVEAHEATPGNEEWGLHGFTLPTIETARAKLKELERLGEMAEKRGKK